MTRIEIKLANANGVLDKLMETEINKRIRENYTISNELAILRQRDTKPEEFEQYNAFVEGVKAEVKAEIAQVIE